MDSFDVIIIGGGAAGLMCAAGAVRRGRRVLVLERNAKVAEKVRISGGGRANFTNLHAVPANYLSDNPRFCVSALKRYTQQDFIALVERHGIAYHEKTLGQLFCDDTSQRIIDLLLAEARGADIRTEIKVTRVARDGGRFTVTTDKGDFAGEALVIATGGPSIPKMGASRFAYDVARQFGLRLVTPRPGLVPLTFGAGMLERLKGLSGVAVEATATLGKVTFREALLFTHRGLSGPAILQISSYWRPGEAVILNLLPDVDLFAELKAMKQAQPRKDAATALAQFLSKSLAQRLCDWTGAAGRLADLPDRTLKALGEQVNAWAVTPDGTEGDRTAEVTVGGVDTRDLSSQTMAARDVPGLYFIGECVDVTGHLGGFNFQWAWASGHACGEVV